MDKYLYIPSCVIIKKDEIQKCIIVNNVGDLYNIRCVYKNGKQDTILPRSVTWSEATQVLSQIYNQL